jgi:hypothetical protein
MGGLIVSPDSPPMLACLRERERRNGDKESD